MILTWENCITRFEDWGKTKVFFNLRSSVFWNVTLHILVVNVQRFGSSIPRECREKEDLLF